MTLSEPRMGWAFLVAGAILLAVGVASPASANPPGNNGTIKVDAESFDQQPGNEPHVGCEFQIDFYGYEANIPVSMVFEVKPPTGDAVIHTETGVLDDDDASGANEAGLDGEFLIDLGDDLAGYQR